MHPPSAYMPIHARSVHRDPGNVYMHFPCSAQETAFLERTMRLPDRFRCPRSQPLAALRQGLLRRDSDSIRRRFSDLIPGLASAGWNGDDIAALGRAEALSGIADSTGNVTVLHNFSQ